MGKNAETDQTCWIIEGERCPQCGGQVATNGANLEGDTTMRWCLGGGWSADAQACDWGDE